MGFYASSFIYRGIPSETFNLYMSTSSSGADSKSSGASMVTIVKDKLYRRSKPYITGISQTGELSFPIEITSPVEIDAANAELIQKWLFGHLEFSPLQVQQDDMYNVYFNCVLNKPEIIRAGNIIYGFTADVECDSNFGWEYPKKFTFDSTALTSTNGAFNIFNSSDDNDYLYPLLEFTMDGLGGNFSIFNASDNNREFAFTGLMGNEVMTVNNDLQILTSSTGLFRLGNFNKKFLRLVPGINRLYVSKIIPSLSITCSFARKVSG